MKSRFIYLIIMFILAFPLVAHSAFWESEVTQVGTIGPRANSDYGRLIFKFDLPEQLNGVIIDYAELIFAAAPDTGSGFVCLMGAFPVTRSWEAAGLSWSGSWTNSGGDYTDSIYSTCLIRNSRDRLTRMDITDIVQMWVDITSTNHGLIVMPLESSNRFLKLHDSNKLPPGVKAKVRVFYSKEPDN
jgi:hypothetical protein